MTSQDHFLIPNLGYIKLGTRVNCSLQPHWENEAMTIRLASKCASNCGSVAPTFTHTIVQWRSKRGKGGGCGLPWVTGFSPLFGGRKTFFLLWGWVTLVDVEARRATLVDVETRGQHWLMLKREGNIG